MPKSAHSWAVQALPAAVLCASRQQHQKASGRAHTTKAKEPLTWDSALRAASVMSSRDAQPENEA